VARHAVVYPEKRILCPHHETPVPGGIEGAGEVVAAEAVRYELFERKAISWEEGAGRVRYRQERVVYDVHESGPGINDPDYVARYEGLSPAAAVVLAFPALSNHVFGRFPRLSTRPVNRF
jgi:hypothetical protein